MSPVAFDAFSHSRIAAWLRPDEVRPALNFVALLESMGQMNLDEANEWSLRITGWVRFNAVDTDAAPSA
jgi:hypothetical protein